MSEILISILIILTFFALVAVVFVPLFYHIELKRSIIKPIIITILLLLLNVFSLGLVAQNSELVDDLFTIKRDELDKQNVELLVTKLNDWLKSRENEQ